MTPDHPRHATTEQAVATCGAHRAGALVAAERWLVKAVDLYIDQNRDLEGSVSLRRAARLAGVTRQTFARRVAERRAERKAAAR